MHSQTSRSELHFIENDKYFLQNLLNFSQKATENIISKVSTNPHEGDTHVTLNTAQMRQNNRTLNILPLHRNYTKKFPSLNDDSGLKLGKCGSARHMSEDTSSATLTKFVN